MSKDAFTPRTTEQRLPLPLNGTIYTTTRLSAPEKPTPVVGATMESELGLAWADSIIISVVTQPQGTQEVLVIQHARIPNEADQLASNWEQVDVPIAGNSYPGVVRTVILPAGSHSETLPAIGSAMPVVVSSLFDGSGYVLYDRNSSKTGSPLEPVFRIDRRTFVKKTNRLGVMVDEFSNKSNRVEMNLYYRGEIVSDGHTVEYLFDTPQDSFWDAFSATVGAVSTFYRREGRQLTKDWFSVETVPIVSGAISGAVLTVQDYKTTVDFTWPAVLTALDVIDWEYRDGGVWNAVQPYYSRQRYSGPTSAQIVLKWKATKFTDIATPVVPQPLPIDFVTPNFSVNIPPTLHAEFIVFFTNGTVDPVFKYTESSKTFPATNYVSWAAMAAGIVVSDVQKPYKGGFLRETTTVFPPT